MTHSPGSVTSLHVGEGYASFRLRCPQSFVQRRRRNTRGAQLSLKRSPARFPTNYPATGTWDYGAPIG